MKGVGCCFLRKKVYITSGRKFNKKHFCSQKCSKLSSTSKIEIDCSYCNKPIKVKPSKIGKHEYFYCDNNCRYKHIKSGTAKIGPRPTIVLCPQCGKTVLKRTLRNCVCSTCNKVNNKAILEQKYLDYQKFAALTPKPKGEYSKELLEEAIKQCSSYKELCDYFGMSCSGAAVKILKTKISLYNISIDHFSKFGRHRRGKICPRIDIQDYISNKLRISSHSLKEKLIQEGLFEKNVIAVDLPNILANLFRLSYITKTVITKIIT